MMFQEDMSTGIFQKEMSAGVFQRDVPKGYVHRDFLRDIFVMADFFWRKTERLSELLAHGLITVTYVPTSLFSLVRKQLNARAAS